MTTPGAPAGRSGAPGGDTPGDAVRRVPVEFPSEGAPLRGELFLPAGGPTGARLPGVVCTGTWTSVRQQMTDRYAHRLAAAGLAALSFDFRGYGASGGEPRQVESPALKARDIAAATAFLAGREEVDAGRVGGLAVCASAGYMAYAIAGGAPLRAFAAVAAWLHDPSTVGLVYGGEAGVGRRLEVGRAAAEHYRRTGEVRYVPAESPDDPASAMTGVAFYEEPERGRLPEWTNRFAEMQWVEWLTYDALAPAPAIRVPTLLLHSEGAALPENVRRFAAGLAGPSTLTFLRAGPDRPYEHTEFYDREPLVTHAARAAAVHLRTALES